MCVGRSSAPPLSGEACQKPREGVSVRVLLLLVLLALLAVVALWLCRLVVAPFRLCRRLLICS